MKQHLSAEVGFWQLGVKRGKDYLYFSVKISERRLKARFEIIAQNKPHV